MIVRFIRLVLAFLVISISGALADNSYKRPSSAQSISALLDVLFRTQDDIALEGKEGLPVQRHILGLLAREIESRTQRADWTREEAGQLVEYALSGGERRLAVRALRQIPDLWPEGIAARAVIAYLAGNKAEAGRLLPLVDVARTRGRVRPLLSLARGLLAERMEEPSAVQHHETARVLAPGTLIEEAALRRLAGIAFREGDAERLLRLASQYWQRFNRSPYRHEMAAMAAQSFTLADQPNIRRQWIRVIDLMSKTEARQAMLKAAHVAVVSGNIDLAEMLVRELEVTKAGVEVISNARARLLKAVLDLTSENVQEAAARLRTFDTNGLSESDLELLDVSRQLSHAIQAPFDSVHDSTASDGKAGSSDFTDHFAQLAAIDELLAR